MKNIDKFRELSVDITIMLIENTNNTIEALGILEMVKIGYMKTSQKLKGEEDKSV